MATRALAADGGFERRNSTKINTRPASGPVLLRLEHPVAVGIAQAQAPLGQGVGQTLGTFRKAQGDARAACGKAGHLQLLHARRRAELAADVLPLAHAAELYGNKEVRVASGNASGSVTAAAAARFDGFPASLEDAERDHGGQI